MTTAARDLRFLDPGVIAIAASASVFHGENPYSRMTAAAITSGTNAPNSASVSSVAPLR
jgi:hypothetical protein